MNRILIIDFGSQYTHLISRRIRDLGVYTEILNAHQKIGGFVHDQKNNVKGIILSGGPASVYEKGSPSFDLNIFKINIPVLGICYGMHIVASQFSGRVQGSKNREYGKTELHVDNRHPLFKGLNRQETVWMSHGDTIIKMPVDFMSICSSKNCDYAGIAHTSKDVFAIQFHPEVRHTIHGVKILANFISLCKCRNTWNSRKYFQQIKHDVIRRIGSKNVFLLVSGGVDSSVLFQFLSKILGKRRVTGLHIDNGLMRKNESKSIEAYYRKMGLDNFHVFNAADIFLERLKGITSPEKKRKIIGNTFIDVQQQVMRSLNLDSKKFVLCQGTIYPDTIESGGTKHADVIKTHHNQVPIVKTLIREGRLIEPFAQLYKDEVREIGQLIKMPPAMIHRHPFPGPGLGVRILCTRSARKDAVISKIQEALNGYHTEAFQVFPVAVKTVGVQGDKRSFSYCAGVIGPLNWDQLEKLSVDLTNHLKQVNRVVYSLNKELFLNVNTAVQGINAGSVRLLQEVDHLIIRLIRRHRLYRRIWQMPVILLPLLYQQKPVICIRPIESTEAMTANFFKMKFSVYKEIRRDVLAAGLAGDVIYDITHKPPGTIEWE